VLTSLGVPMSNKIGSTGATAIADALKGTAVLTDYLEPRMLDVSRSSGS